jgi:DNA-binding response OmpR family regulator
MARILIVEDTLEIAESLQQYLEDEGYEAVIATKAAQALALQSSYRPELIVLDLGLPDRDGYDVLQQIREGGDPVPVLILSARKLEADKVQGFRLGADDYVTKPFSVMELLARITAVLRRARASASNATAAAQAPTTLSDDEIRTRFGLTPRQVEIARLVGEGHTNAEIAARLDISFFTVRTHVQQILARLGVASRAAVGALLYGG